MSASLWRNMRLAPSASTIAADAIADAALVIEGERIAWLGAAASLPAQYAGLPTHDLGGRWVTPGLLDCHTHLVFAGTRADEFAERLAGATYEDIARRGGGILSTVRATRAASEEELLRQSARRLQALMDEGVTTVEIKSGYGLDLETEGKILRVARELGRRYPVRVKTTFLGAHALPAEFAGSADDYIAEVCERMLPALHGEGLVDAVDVFCENIGFSLAQSERVFDAAARLGLPVKMHAEQLSNMGGSVLAAQCHALSTDHLEFLDEDGVHAMRAAGTVAVMLPGAFYFLREKQLPPLALLRKHGVPMAVATDCNPGTAPSTSLLLAMNMAATLFRMTVDEIFAGVTRNAARALGLSGTAGTLAPGMAADFAVWDIDSLAELVYWSGLPRCAGVMQAGVYRALESRHG